MRRRLVSALAVVLALGCTGATASEPPTTRPAEPGTAEAAAEIDLARLAGEQGRALAEHAADAFEARRALVLYDRDLPAAGELQRTFAARFEELDGQVLARWRFTAAGLGPATRAVVEMMPLDVVVVAAAPGEVIPAIRGLRSVGYSGPILGGAGFAAIAWEEQPDWGQVVFVAPAAGSDGIEVWRVEGRATVLASSPTP